MPPATSLSTVESPSELAVWDASTLTGLVGDNPAIHRRLLEKFLLNAQAQVAGIGTAAQASDGPTLNSLAHTLKSAARSVGAMRLGEVSEAVEMAGQTNDAARYTPLARALPQALADAQAQIRAMAFEKY